MKETLKQMQISKGGLLGSSPSCSAQGPLVESAAGARGETWGPLGCWDLLGGCEAKKGPDEPGFTLGTWLWLDSMILRLDSMILQLDSMILKVSLNPPKISDSLTRGDAVSVDRAIRGRSGPCTQTHRALPAPVVPSSHLVRATSAQLPPAAGLGIPGGPIGAQRCKNCTKVK